MRQVQTDWKDEARGKWTGILGQLGVDQKYLRNVNGPCPSCGGTDRFRYDNKEGRGTFYCNSCGPGDGIKLLQNVRRCDFKEALEAVKSVLGIVQAEPLKKEPTPKERAAHMNRVLEESMPVGAGSLVHAYLKARGLERTHFPATIRFNPHCWFERDLFLPAMIALVQDEHGKNVNIHRTFLSPDGSGKANVLEPRKVMPGLLPPGSAVRLFSSKERMGIAEGIETAWAAARLFKMPVWAALNATLLSQWVPPSGVQELFIFGDHDKSHAGQEVAHGLARRLLSRRDNELRVKVLFPEEEGDDWNDVLLKDPSRCLLPSPSHTLPPSTRLC